MRFFSKPGDSRFTLVQRAFFVCTVFTCIVVLAWRTTPILKGIYATDTYYISYGITLYFAVQLVYVLRQILFVNTELEIVKRHLIRNDSGGTPRRDIQAPATSFIHEIHHALTHLDSNRSRDEILEIAADTLDRKVAHVALHAKTLVNLGFIGTLVGIMVVMSADLTSLFRPNADISAVFGTITGGMKIAIGTSIIGVIGKMWIDHLGIILEEGSRHLVSNIVKMEIQNETQTIPLS